MREPSNISINGKTLEQILIDHMHWMYEDSKGWRNMMANLHGANLSGANLSGANLRGANLSGANLSGANLREANLSGANLREANLSDAYISEANLSGANLRGANLFGTNLSFANLGGANLREANLSFVNLTEANLYHVDLDKPEQIRKGIKLSEPMIGWKKCRDDVIVKLEIPRGAMVFSINNAKCRTDKAKVVEIIGADRAYSFYKFFSYYAGDFIEVFDFNTEYNTECGKGIHFFRTREEAEKYNG